MVHLLLSKITTKEDIDFAIDDLIATGDTIKLEAENLRTIVMDVIQHPKMSLYFNNEHKVYNERDIVTPTGKILRPDRININPYNEAIIIDYKTGDHKPSHAAQLNSYASILSTMNYKVQYKYLVYINESIEVIEV